MYVVGSECFQVVMSVTNISVSYGRYFFQTTVQSKVHAHGITFQHEERFVTPRREGLRILERSRILRPSRRGVTKRAIL
eukprot:COSAG01_NODE_49943_length_367_cov_64.414179_1_plen_78_part_01